MSGFVLGCNRGGKGERRSKELTDASEHLLIAGCILSSSLERELGAVLFFSPRRGGLGDLECCIFERFRRREDISQVYICFE